MREQAAPTFPTCNAASVPRAAGGNPGPPSCPELPCLSMSRCGCAAGCLASLLPFIVQEKMASVSGDAAAVRETLGKAAKEFSQLPEDQKKPYIEMAEADKKRYEQVTCHSLP